jgi:hypothetical protein
VPLSTPLCGRKVSARVVPRGVAVNQLDSTPRQHQRHFTRGRLTSAAFLLSQKYQGAKPLLRLRLKSEPTPRVAGVRSPDCFAGASTIRMAPMLLKHRPGAEQTCALFRKVDCHDRHDSGMSKTRPCGESDHAAIRRWITGCQQQENSECDIEAQHHRRYR